MFHSVLTNSEALQTGLLAYENVWKFVGFNRPIGNPCPDEDQHWSKYI